MILPPLEADRIVHADETEADETGAGEGDPEDLTAQRSTATAAKIEIEAVAVAAVATITMSTKSNPIRGTTMNRWSKTIPMTMASTAMIMVMREVNPVLAGEGGVDVGEVGPIEMAIAIKPSVMSMTNLKRSQVTMRTLITMMTMTLKIVQRPQDRGAAEAVGTMVAVQNETSRGPGESVREAIQEARRIWTLPITGKSRHGMTRSPV
jgi:hypothetical protein